MNNEVDKNQLPEREIGNAATDQETPETDKPLNWIVGATYRALQGAVIQRPQESSSAPPKNPLPLPEKVRGLETLAAAGLPTPKHRLYLDASYFAKDATGNLNKLEEKIKDFMQQIAEDTDNIAADEEQNRDQEPYKIMIRSAHPRESAFSGGAFHSEESQIRDLKDYRYVASSIGQIRTRYIIGKSKPETSTRVRRDINLRNIRNFDVNKMGVYLNEKIPSIREITAIPLDNGEISLRYFNADSLHVENVDPAKSRNALVQDIQKAQTLFKTPQEFEIHIQKNGQYVFVQAKSVTPEETKDDPIPEEEFSEGLKSYHPNFEFGHKYDTIRANQRDIIRHTHALIIDEEQWIAEWIQRYMAEQDRFEGKYIFSEVDKLNESLNIYNLLYQKPELRIYIMGKYRELMNVAETVEMATLICKKTKISSSDPSVDWNNHEEFYIECSEIMDAREALTPLASVLFTGKTAGDNNIHQDKHVVLGAGGLSQITIFYHLDENARRTNDDYSMRCRFERLKNGDPLTVMIKKGVTSLYVAPCY